jgi:hypothetical protein
MRQAVRQCITHGQFDMIPTDLSEIINDWSICDWKHDYRFEPWSDTVADWAARK